MHLQRTLLLMGFGFVLSPVFPLPHQKSTDSPYEENLADAWGCNYYLRLLNSLMLIKLLTVVNPLEFKSRCRSYSQYFLSLSLSLPLPSLPPSLYLLFCLSCESTIWFELQVQTLPHCLQRRDC